MQTAYLWSSHNSDTGKRFFLGKRKRLVLVPVFISIPKCRCLLEHTKQIKTHMYSMTWPSLTKRMRITTGFPNDRINFSHIKRKWWIEIYCWIAISGYAIAKYIIQITNLPRRPWCLRYFTLLVFGLQKCWSRATGPCTTWCKLSVEFQETDNSQSFILYMVVEIQSIIVYWE